MKFHVIILFCCFIGLFQSIQAQKGFNPDPFAGRVKWIHQIEPNTNLNINQVVTLTMTAEIDKGLHVFSVQPPKESANLPTTFEPDEKTVGCFLEGSLSEEGKLIKEYDDVFSTDVFYYKEKVIFKQKIKLTAGNIIFMGTLKYQVCDEQGMCTAQTHRVEIKLEAK